MVPGRIISGHEVIVGQTGIALVRNDQVVEHRQVEDLGGLPDLFGDFEVGFGWAQVA